MQPKAQSHGAAGVGRDHVWADGTPGLMGWKHCTHVPPNHARCPPPAEQTPCVWGQGSEGSRMGTQRPRSGVGGAAALSLLREQREWPVHTPRASQGHGRLRPRYWASPSSPSPSWGALNSTRPPAGLGTRCIGRGRHLHPAPRGEAVSPEPLGPPGSGTPAHLCLRTARAGLAQGLQKEQMTAPGPVATQGPRLGGHTTEPTAAAGQSGMWTVLCDKQAWEAARPRRGGVPQEGVGVCGRCWPHKAQIPADGKQTTAVARGSQGSGHLLPKDASQPSSGQSTE